jgi:ABC-type branched-subunit amino acid transport system substrate-binding protein
MSTAISGPAAELGLNMRYGVLAAFAEVNREGGVNGKKLELVVLDDGYEPSRTAPNMQALVNVHNVLGTIGNVGTPTAIASLPIVRRARVPFFGAFSGAEMLRQTPPDPFVINFRASYAQETATMVDGLIEAGIKPEEIAFFTQLDSFGDDGYFGGLAALRKYKDLPQSAVAHGRYSRNSLDVENGLAELLLHRPEPRAVIMVGTYAPCARMIELSKQIGFNPTFLGVSFIGCDTLRKSLGQDSRGIIMTQVVPHYHSDLPIVVRYRAAMERFDEDLPYDSGSLEGYVSANILIKALHTLSAPVTPERIVEALETLGTFDIGLGVPLSLGPSDHQACDRVWAVRLNQIHADSFSWDELRTSSDTEL